MNFKHHTILFISAFILIAATIDLNNLFEYDSQSIPAYITRDNTRSNFITNEGATLGRVLFYDKSLSANYTIACASCHKQEFAFGDTAVQSVGLDGGLTGRHSMRLINSRFSEEEKFFWDERASTLEDQSSMPIQDFTEMGFSGDNQPAIDSLIRRLEQIDYYAILFKEAFGDELITEGRIQFALAQFVRSIQSFDSKFDVGRAQANDNNQPFTNFTAEENQGKQLFLAPPPMGGAGCQGCHRAPEFDIDPATQNNGIIGVAGSATETDLTNTKAPTLRDLYNNAGELNGPLMHDASITSFDDLIDHYSNVPNNAQLDPRLMNQQFNFTQAQKDAIEAFLKTLTGSDVYTNERWSNPFDENGALTIIGTPTAVTEFAESREINAFPNPTKGTVYVEGFFSNVLVFSAAGHQIMETTSDVSSIDLSGFDSGIFYFKFMSHDGSVSIKKVLKI